MSTQVHNVTAEEVASQETAAKLPRSLEERLIAFRGRLRLLKLLEVGFAAIIGFLVAYLLVFTVERFVAMPAWCRTIVLLIGTAGFSISLPMALRRWYWNTRRLEQVARFLRTTFPSLGDEILSIIEMLHQDSQQGASPRLIAAATAQTNDRVAKQELAKAAPAQPARRWGFVAVGAISGVLLLAAIVPAAAGNAWHRFLSPWSNSARFTFVQFADLPESLVVPYAESFDLAVPLAADSEWQPATASAQLGSFQTTADVDAGTYNFALPGQSQPGPLKIVAGDRMDQIEVIPMTRPELSQITASIIPPAYLQYSDPIQQTSTATRFRALAGSSIQFDLLANREVTNATLDGQQIAVDGQRVLTDEIALTDDQQFVLNWRDQHGLQPSHPIELQVKVLADQAPTIVLEKFPQPVLLESRSLKFGFAGRDDFGIQKVGLQWEGQFDSVSNPNPAVGEKLLVAGSPQTQTVREMGIFSAKLENVSPQKLTFRLFVEDYKPGRGRIYSRPQTLHLMSNDEHVVWINEKMQRWKSKADAIYEQELLLAEQNRELQKLSDEQLGEPENLRRLENQVAAERENAKRLDEAVSEGGQLIEQAMMNDEMRADQVERWASSLQTLLGIADQDMPRVADQLSKIEQQAEREQAERAQTEREQAERAQAGQEPAESQNANGQPSSENEAEDEKNASELEAEMSSDRSPKSAGEDRGPKAQGKPNQQKESDPQNKDSQAPQLRDGESSMLEQGDQEESSDKEKDGNKQNGGGKLTLPTTELVNPQQDDDQSQDSDQQQADSEDAGKEANQADMDDAVEAQQKLLREFEEARDAMDDVMADFENSTFVKRLKAASRTQLQVASQLNRLLSLRFGSPESLTERVTDPVEEIADSQRQIYESVSKLKIDLEAYQSREPDDSRQAILDEMQALKMLVKLNEMPQRLKRNRLGDGIHRSEFWADTFDRWAEEMVPPAESGGGGGGGDENPSLPPSIVLDVLKQIDDEMNLRDETRGFDRARAAMSATEQQERNDALTVLQMEIEERSLNTIDDIYALPNGGRSFDSEISKMKNAVTAMNEAMGMLYDQTTGEPTLAAESAAIEALLESRRQDPPKNDNPDPSDSEKDGSESLAGGSSSMDRLGLGKTNPKASPRDVGAGTAANNDRIPERYRDGIDSFTNALSRLKK